ncbi:hypothetical protein DAPK24_029660 [Pichia kluyveri]|uniref:Golgi apparatus membrane protein TVP15 n=1 Tax=Pichia kluyveri TaxID=36015 RepID=A0AAV5R6Z8_PICKL|nr:hypothetical protein DAPK24_029660 [Pichia kluyveri]
MDSINLSEPPKYTIIFKIINFIIATLSILCGLSEIFTKFDYFFQGILIILIGFLIIYLEFKIPPKLFTYFSSFFSFLGRGSIYIIIAILNLHGSFIRFIIALFILLVGIVYIGLEFINNIEPPANMSGENGFINNDEFDDII